MEVIRIKQVDAFTRTPFSGNPAGVVLDADFLDTKTMQKIAMEMNLSETAFVLEPTHPDADIRIRWFTPSQEVNLCGHATIAEQPDGTMQPIIDFLTNLSNPSL